MYVNILIDCDANALIIHNSFIHTTDFDTRNTFANKWSTMAGSFLTLFKAEVKIKLPKLYFTAHIFVRFYVTSQKSNYDFIFGQDILEKLRMNLYFQKQLRCLKIKKILMKSINFKMRTNFAIEESKNIKSAAIRIKKILDTGMNSDEQFLLYTLLKKHENMFDDTLGNYTSTEYKIEHLDKAKPYHAKPFPIPILHEETLKTKVNGLENIDVLKRKNNSKWAAPSLIIPKKNGTVRFICDFRELNE